MVGSEEIKKRVSPRRHKEHKGNKKNELVQNKKLFV